MAYRGRWAWERGNHTGKAPRDQRRTAVIPVFLPTMGGGCKPFICRLTA